MNFDTNNILCYIRKEFQAPPISMWVGQAHSNHIQKLHLCLTLAAHHLGKEACYSV